MYSGIDASCGHIVEHSIERISVVHRISVIRDIQKVLRDVVKPNLKIVYHEQFFTIRIQEY